MGLPQEELFSSECTMQNSELEAGKCPCATWASGEARYVGVFQKMFFFICVAQLKVV